MSRDWVPEPDRVTALAVAVGYVGEQAERCGFARVAALLAQAVALLEDADRRPPARGA